MVTAKDVAELRKRYRTPDDCNITRIKGAYVDSEKNIVTRLDEKFFSLKEDEIHKYLDIVREPFKTKGIEDNVLTLKFEDDSDVDQVLQQLVKSQLDSEAAEEDLYRRIIEDYGYFGHFIILMFFDVYDVIKTTTDGNEIDESEETYAYIITAICPVHLQNPALQYEAVENSFKALDRKWIVGKPMQAFVYPAFDNRSADQSEVMFYTKDPSEPGHDVMENILQCKPQYTATEHRETFEASIGRATESEELTEQFTSEVNAVFEGILLEEEVDRNVEPKRLSVNELQSALTVYDMPEHYAKRVAEDYGRRYEGNEFPKVAWLYNKKARSKFYAKKEKDRVRDMLSRSSRALSSRGQMDLAGEIEEYLERTR